MKNDNKTVTYQVTWYKKDRNPNPILRHNNITLNNPTGEVNIDAQKVVQLFMRAFGSLKKNEIIQITMTDEWGKPLPSDVFEPIVPTDKELPFIKIKGDD